MIVAEFEHAGLPCRVVLQDMGHHCGYVAVRPGHPWYEVDYSARVLVPPEFSNRKVDIARIGVIAFFLESMQEEDGLMSLDTALDVHGGLTYSQGEDDLWWFGFDCAHSSDGRWKGEPGWKDAAYVEAECRQLAEQPVFVTEWAKRRVQ